MVIATASTQDLRCVCPICIMRICLLTRLNFLRLQLLHTIYLPVSGGFTGALNIILHRNLPRKAREDSQSTSMLRPWCDRPAQLAKPCSIVEHEEIKLSLCCYSLLHDKWRLRAQRSCFGTSVRNVWLAEPAERGRSTRGFAQRNKNVPPISQTWKLADWDVPTLL